MDLKSLVINAVLFGLPGLFFIIAVLMLLDVLRKMVRTSAARAWPTTSGIVVSAAVEVVDMGDGANMYVPKIIYRYQMNGREFTCDRYAISRVSGQYSYAGQKQDVETIVQDYPAGRSVSVHYDARNPQDAALVIKAEGIGSSLIFIIVLVSLGCGILAFSLWLRFFS